MFGEATRGLRREDGFTMVELLIVSALTMVVLVAVYNIFVSGLNNYDMVDAQNQAVRDNGKNMLIMAKYLRESEGLYGPSQLGDPGDYGVCTRVDSDGDEKYEYLTFKVDAATKELRMTVKDDTGQTTTLVYGRDVQNAALARPMFTYYDSGGAVITTTSQRAARTASMQIRIVTDADPTQPPSEFDSTTLVTFRNSQL